MTTDFTIQNHGSIFMLYPKTPEAQAWIDEHLPADAQRWGPGTAIEHRYIADIVAGIQNDGLSVA